MLHIKLFLLKAFLIKVFLTNSYFGTLEAIKMLDSTPHAVVRNAVDVKQTDVLMKLLENRLKYGLILDDFTNTFLINKMLKDQNYRDASKSAILMMLQEEYDIPIAKNMATYAIFMYINHMKTGMFRT